VVKADAMAIDARALRAGDLELICRHREEMFRDAGQSEAVLSVMTDHFRTWLGPRLADGSYFGFVLTDHNNPVGGIGLMTIDWPPHPSHPTQSRRGYILNVFVEPSHRRRGLARELMRLADAEFASRGVEFAVLHASEKGQPLYLGLGWNSTTEMTKRLDA
jgi:ribosomal protein S18 acetylase RimI-like enzyme